ncbi:hypothetical protein GJ496_001671 [Pomphorhynchus laevis]|nr:hypothetical protein GJ496_001671 [Pomphorhynchus laevis]
MGYLIYSSSRERSLDSAKLEVVHKPTMPYISKSSRHDTNYRKHSILQCLSLICMSCHKHPNQRFKAFEDHTYDDKQEKRSNNYDFMNEKYKNENSIVSKRKDSNKQNESNKIECNKAQKSVKRDSFRTINHYRSCFSVKDSVSDDITYSIEIEVRLKRKHAQEQIGLTLCYMMDGRKCGIFVRKVDKGSIAWKTGQIMAGDHILAVNGRKLRNRGIAIKAFQSCQFLNITLKRRISLINEVSKSANQPGLRNSISASTLELKQTGLFLNSNQTSNISVTTSHHGIFYDSSYTFSHEDSNDLNDDNSREDEKFSVNDEIKSVPLIFEDDYQLTDGINNDNAIAYRRCSKNFTVLGNLSNSTISLLMTMKDSKLNSSVNELKGTNLNKSHDSGLIAAAATIKQLTETNKNSFKTHLKERRKQINEERSLFTTDDERLSELKLGKYWTRTQRKQHLEKAKQRLIAKQHRRLTNFKVQNGNREGSLSITNALKCIDENIPTTTACI